MARPSLREPLLDAGQRVMFRKGYVGTGVREVAAEAGAPQGSFTNHFRSKEAFAQEVLDRYFAHTLELVHEALDDRTSSPRERIRRYLDLITDRLAADGFARGCLIGDLSLEAPGLSERLRERLTVIFTEWREPFAACIAEGQAAGEIPTAFGSDDLADFLLAAWEGAILRMKVERSAAPLERFKSIVFATVFREEP
jgi:TetR/AcrR family transcriptional regulator, transcriptional repressor for nem operon